MIKRITLVSFDFVNIFWRFFPLSHLHCDKLIENNVFVVENLFVRTSKILIRLNVLISEAIFHAQNSILFLFTMKHSYLLTTKMKPELNDSL